MSCKPKETTHQHSNETEETSSKNRLEEKKLQAKEILLKYPTLVITKSVDDRVTLKNKHTLFTLELSYDEIIEGKHKLLAIGDSTLLEKLNKPTDWGKSPTWLPRPSQATVKRGAMHYALEDGSIWGNISVTTASNQQETKLFLTQHFTEQGMMLATESHKGDSLILIFQRLTEEKEKRRVTCTLTPSENSTILSMQYSYGMP